MIERTQSSLYPNGNCWQTAVACVLGVEPDTLPSQAEHERVPPGEKYGKGYSNALNAYLRRHHGLFYVQQDPHEVAPFARIREPGYHMLVGPTVRTPQTKQLHCVVARHGEVVWDPHPSRAGLVDVTGWGFLVPFPDKWARNWDRIPCVCPACAIGVADRMQAAEKRVQDLEAAVREHRDQRGDDRCWEDDLKLYAVLPEGAPAPDALALPPRDVFLASCERYHACRQAPGTPPAEGEPGRWCTADEVQLIELGRRARATDGGAT